ncbi:MAG: transcriptional repressor [Sphaerochaetaceae bacterium]|nr:transcriptional repressor [Sphaerochaetaceae bacterium]
MTRGAYSTKQSNRILSYIETLNGHFTASDIYEHFKNTDTPVGSATIYRQLEKFIQSGLVNRYVIDESTGCCYEFIGDHAHSHGTECYHCKCESCGKLIHLDCDEISHLNSHILSEHNFLINPHKTVFYGLCADCRAKAGIR